MVPSHLQADQAQSRSRSPDLPPKRQAQGCLHSTKDRLVAITEAATARMLVPSTPCGVVHNSSERPTPASQCVLNAFSLRSHCPGSMSSLACQRGGMLMNSPHERAAGPTSGATRRKRVVERQRECAEIHGGSIKDPLGAPQSRIHREWQHDGGAHLSPFANAKRPARVTTGRSGPARAKLLPLLWPMVDRDSCQAEGVPSKGPPLPRDAVPRSPAHTNLRARRIGQPPFQPIWRGDRKCV